MGSTDELIQNVIDVLDSAHSQRAKLAQLLDTLTEAEDQVKQSATAARKQVRSHFEDLQTRILKTLNKRLSELEQEIDHVEKTSLKPLSQCEDMINQNITTATQVMEEGRCVLANSPDSNLDALEKFKDYSQTKNLSSLPEVPCMTEVPYISADLSNSPLQQVRALLITDGKILARAPVHIVDLQGCPGGILVKWMEVDEELEISDFCLQYCRGVVDSIENPNKTFHTVYHGPNTSHLVKQLQPNTQYSFRVSCRTDTNSNWGVWSLPRVAMTTIPHYQWAGATEGYSTTCENRTATRETGLTQVLYSDSASYLPGYPISFRILDVGEKSPLDGIAISVKNDITDLLKRPGTVFVGTDGSVHIDGQEMKTRLPVLQRKSTVTIETEPLSSGKVRVSVQVEEKEVTFDWKFDKEASSPMEPGPVAMPGDTTQEDGKPAQQFYFAMMFSHEDWKITVD